MSERPTSELRLASARVWHAAADEPKPTWDDVEIIVRLRVTDRDYARTLLIDQTAVLAIWDPLMAALAETGGSAPRAGEAQATSGVVPVADPGGVVGARLRALREWMSGLRDSGVDVDANISEEELLRLAQNPPSSAQRFKGRFTSNVRKFDEQILEVFAGIDARNDGVAPTDLAPGSATSGTEEAAPRHAGPSTRARAEAASDPVVEPATRSTVSGARAIPQTVRTGQTERVDFSHFQYPEAGAIADEPGAVTFDATGGESVKLSWPSAPSDGRLHVFSVVTNTGYLPQASPTLGDVVASTFDREITDTSEFRGPVRYVAVWRSTGSSEQAARLAQPTLWAVGETVLPVRSCTVREDEGTVIGNWEPIDGAERFDVYRVPVGRGLEQRREVDPNHKLPDHFVTTGGFTDHEAVPGTSYEYRVYAVATIGGGSRNSPAVASTVTLEAIAEPVLDLEVTPSEGSETTFDLSWTPPPLGHVEIYRNEQAPFSGIDLQVIDRSALEGQGGLTASLRVERARDHEDGRVHLRNVPWPQGWSRAYFTPATVVNDNLIRVGPSQSLTRAGAPSQVRLVERVDKQFITFAWPLGSPEVRVYQGPPNSQHVDPGAETAIFDVSVDDYRKYGGAHLTTPLPADGCSVHIVGVSYSGGKARYSKPVTVQYEGLARVRYAVEDVSPQRRSRRGNVDPTSRRIMVWSETAPSLDLVLIHNPTRLPLHPRDGVEIARRHLSLGHHPQVCFDPVPTQGRVGYMRLFADVPSAFAHKVAVIDPPLRALILAGE